jgi:hypothetical protein
MTCPGPDCQVICACPLTEIPGLRAGGGAVPEPASCPCSPSASPVSVRGAGGSARHSAQERIGTTGGAAAVAAVGLYGVCSCQRAVSGRAPCHDGVCRSRDSRMCRRTFVSALFRTAVTPLRQSLPSFRALWSSLGSLCPKVRGLTGSLTFSTLRSPVGAHSLADCLAHGQ